MRHDLRLGLVLALILLVGGCGSADSEPNADARSSEGFVESPDGVRLRYRVLGESGDTLLVIHGGPGFTMHSLMDDLAPLAQSHALLFYDQRGAGGSSLVSDSVSLDAQRFVEDLEAIRVAFGFEQVSILAHSWGAAVAALYAGTFPDRIGRLIVVSGTPLRRSHLAEAFQLRDARRDTANVRRLREAAEARRADPGDANACRAYYREYFAPFFADASVARRSEADFCAGTPEALRNKVESVDRFVGASLGDWDLRPSARRVSAPSLVIHGAADVIPVVAAREWAVALPQGRLLLLEDVGHFPFLEAPEDFFPALDAFLDGLWPGASEPVGEG